jgi:hypothetical protein
VYPFESEAAAVESFKAWFLKKGGTAWEHRAHFVQKPEMCGFFFLLHIRCIVFDVSADAP